MDLSRALHVAGSPARLHGASSWDLVKDILAVPGLAGDAKTLRPAAGLEDGVTLLPVSALHWLSYATRLRYQDDLLDMYAYWALARYIGLFEHREDGSHLPALVLSKAGRRVRGNQRRVTSEEMGIGFGALLADRWFRRTGAAGLPVSIVDIDAALDDRYVFSGGSRVRVGPLGGRRPDYLLIAPDPSGSGRYRVRVLECKATSTGRGYAIGQLARAAGQLTGITVGGQVPQGLAVSMIMRDRVSYLAVDPEEGTEPSYAVTPELISQAGEFQLRGDIGNMPPELLTSAALRASWAALADFSGNMPALGQWAPAVTQRRLDRQSRQRVTFDTPYGTATGTSVTVGVDGQQLRIRHAVDTRIDQQMTGRPEAITQAQFAFAEGIARFSDASATASLQAGTSLYSATSDGSILSVTLQ